MNASRRFKVGLIQTAMSVDPDENLLRATEKIKAAAEQGATVICLPELFSSRYFCQREDAELFDLAEPIPGPTTEAMSAAAKQAGVVVIASVTRMSTVSPCSA